MAAVILKCLVGMLVIELGLTMLLGLTVNEAVALHPVSSLLEPRVPCNTEVVFTTLQLAFSTLVTIVLVWWELSQVSPTNLCMHLLFL